MQQSVTGKGGDFDYLKTFSVFYTQPGMRKGEFMTPINKIIFYTAIIQSLRKRRACPFRYHSCQNRLPHPCKWSCNHVMYWPKTTSRGCCRPLIRTSGDSRYTLRLLYDKLDIRADLKNKGKTSTSRDNANTSPVYGGRDTASLAADTLAAVVCNAERTSMIGQTHNLIRMVLYSLYNQ